MSAHIHSIVCTVKLLYIYIITIIFYQLIDKFMRKILFRNLLLVEERKKNSPNDQTITRIMCFWYKKYIFLINLLFNNFTKLLLHGFFPCLRAKVSYFGVVFFWCFPVECYLHNQIEYLKFLINSLTEKTIFSTVPNTEFR